MHQHDCHFVDTNGFRKVVIIWTQMSSDFVNSKNSVPID